MNSIWLWTIRPSLIFSEQHCIIISSSNPSNSSQILARPLFYQPIIGILAPLLPVHLWCWSTLLPSECALTNGQPWSECAEFMWNMRKRHYWLFVSALWLLRLQSKPLLFQGELKHGGLATFSAGLLHVSHLDSDQCSELQCLPNAFQNIFFFDCQDFEVLPRCLALHS